MFLMIRTRPDLAYSVGCLSRHSRVLDKPTAEDIVRVKRVLRYLSGTLTKSIVYKSDYRTPLLSRHIISGSEIYLGVRDIFSDPEKIMSGYEIYLGP